MKILAIIWEQCSTAAIMVDGEIVACVSEERFTRTKNEDSYPKRAIEYVLRKSGVAPRELDAIACAGERFDPTAILCHKYSRYSVQDRLREQRKYWYPRIYEQRKVNYFDVFKDKLDLAQYPGDWREVMELLGDGNRDVARENEFFQTFRRKVVSAHLRVDPGKVIFPHHHRCHALYAFFASPIRKEPLLILTADAWGDDMNASVSLAGEGGIRLLSASANFSLGRLYRSMTLLLGMKPDEHEYKIMGLAAYAKPDYFQGPLKVFRDTMYVDGLGFNYHIAPPDLYVYFQRLLEGYRFDAIAGALQRYTEEILAVWTRNCLKASGARRLCFGGGVGMNVKAMMEIAKLPELDDIFVCPSPSDESLAIGACYAAAYDHCVQNGRDPRNELRALSDAYLGPDLEAAETERLAKELQERGDYATRTRVDPQEIAEVLASGRIIGRCVGRSEFGARALGNRSILADPRNPEVVRTINEKVKSRDFWMPFAPSIVEERATDYLVNPKGLSAPYMTIAFETTPLARREIRATLHQADLTCRPQIVSRKTNPEYHTLISAFERLTGVGALLNTSFNIHGEPIVQSAWDALDVLERSGLDGVIIEDHFLLKKVVSSHH